MGPREQIPDWAESDWVLAAGVLDGSISMIRSTAKPMDELDANVFATYIPPGDEPEPQAIVEGKYKRQEDILGKAPKVPEPLNLQLTPEQLMT